jgi:hypothetical protein
MATNMEYTSLKQQGFGNRIRILAKDYVFNGYTLFKGLRTDGGSIPKIFILSAFLILKEVYQFHWITNIIIFAIAIDESAGWFRDAFDAHDQRWSLNHTWRGFFKSNFCFLKDMIYIVNNYEGKPFIKAFFHMPLGYLLAIVYPLAVTTAGAAVFYLKYIKGQDND